MSGSRDRVRPDFFFFWCLIFAEGENEAPEERFFPAAAGEKGMGFKPPRNVCSSQLIEDCSTVSRLVENPLQSWS